MDMTCIKRYLGLKTNFVLFESDRFTQVLLYLVRRNVSGPLHITIKILGTKLAIIQGPELFNDIVLYS